MKVIKYVLKLLIISMLYGSLAYGHNINVPNIGDSSSKFMSISQENRLGDLIYSQILGSFRLISDPMVTSYIQTLGNRLLASNYKSAINYRFLVINNPDINAFAAPGGIIGINSGIIQKTKTEAELAGVLAHEIAHIKARHLSRMYEKSSTIDITTALSVIAAVVAGMYDNDTIGKSLTSLQGFEVQKKINYIRAHEYEADRIAVNILANANINPKAMGSFFRTLLKETNENNQTEFLRTHPLTKNRIVETESLASKYKGKFTDDSYSYQYISVKVSLDQLNTRDFIKQYKYDNDILKMTPSKVIDDYAYALALTKEKKYKKSSIVLNNLVKFLDSKELIEIKNYTLISLAENYLKNDRAEQAISILEDLNNIYPTDNTTLYYLSEAYIKNKEYKKALNKLLPYVIEHKDHRLIIKISEAAYRLNETSLGHEYKGDYLKMIGSLNSAVKFYRLALKYNMKGRMIDQRINSKLKSIDKIRESKDIL